MKKKTKVEELFQVITKIFFFFRLKKSMDINRQIIELSSQIDSIQEFCSFVNTFYNLTKCGYPQWNIRSFNEILRQEVVFENNTDKESRRFFM